MRRTMSFSENAVRAQAGLFSYAYFYFYREVKANMHAETER